MKKSVFIDIFRIFPVTIAQFSGEVARFPYTKICEN